MNTFQDRFQPDPEFPDSRWTWEVEKPFLKDAIVQFAPYDSGFHEDKLPPKNIYLLDPSCRSARMANDKVPVVIYAQDSSAANMQELAWEHVVANSDAIYQALVKKLQAIHTRCLQMFLEEEMPGYKPYEQVWELIQKEIPSPETAIDRFFKLAGISLTTSGLDECCFVGFEFQSGWDLDHGVEVLMHKDRVLAAVGITELANPRGKIIDGIKAVQQCDTDPDDFLIA